MQLLNDFLKYRKIHNTFLLIEKYNYSALMFRKTDISYSKCVDHIKILRKLGLVYVQKEGEKNIVYYTQSGLEIKELLYQIQSLLQQAEVIKNE